jgi:hypothetical protein
VEEDPQTRAALGLVAVAGLLQEGDGLQHVLRHPVALELALADLQARGAVAQLAGLLEEGRGLGRVLGQAFALGMGLGDALAIGGVALVAGLAGRDQLGIGRGLLERRRQKQPEHEGKGHGGLLMAP